MDLIRFIMGISSIRYYHLISSMHTVYIYTHHWLYIQLNGALGRYFSHTYSNHQTNHRITTQIDFVRKIFQPWSLSGGRLLVEPGSLVDPKIEVTVGVTIVQPLPPKKKTHECGGVVIHEDECENETWPRVCSHLELNGAVPMFNTCQLEWIFKFQMALYQNLFDIPSKISLDVPCSGTIMIHAAENPVFQTNRTNSNRRCSGRLEGIAIFIWRETTSAVQLEKKWTFGMFGIGSSFSSVRWEWNIEHQ